MLDNRGGIDVQAWVTAIVGFTICYIVWVAMTPVFNNMQNVIETLSLPSRSITLGVLVQTVWKYAMIINAGGWLIFIVWSNIRAEVQESEYMQDL